MSIHFKDIKSDLLTMSLNRLKMNETCETYYLGINVGILPELSTY